MLPSEKRSGTTVVSPRIGAVVAFLVSAAMGTWSTLQLCMAGSATSLLGTFAQASAIVVSISAVLAFLVSALSLATTTYELTPAAFVHRSALRTRVVRFDEIKRVLWMRGSFSRALIRAPRCSISIRLWALHPRARGLFARQLAAKVSSDVQLGWDALSPRLERPDRCCGACGYPRESSDGDPCSECGAPPDPSGAT